MQPAVSYNELGKHTSREGVDEMVTRRAEARRARIARISVARASAIGLAVGVVGLALVTAGCGGGGSNGAKVAQIGTTTSPSSSSSQSSSSSADPAKYSACMRKNGVPNFPDPDASGRLKITFGVRNGRRIGVDPNSAQFKKARQACQKLAPNGGRPTPQQRAKEQQAALAFSACMRKHGVPKFPDPKFTPEGGTLMTIGKNGGIDPNSPTFKAAQQTCQKLVPGGPLGGGPPRAS
jgi:hypothetical protein